MAVVVASVYVVVLLLCGLFLVGKIPFRISIVFFFSFVFYFAYAVLAFAWRCSFLLYDLIPNYLWLFPTLITHIHIHILLLCTTCYPTHTIHGPARSFITAIAHYLHHIRLHDPKTRAPSFFVLVYIFCVLTLLPCAILIFLFSSATRYPLVDSSFLLLYSFILFISFSILIESGDCWAYTYIGGTYIFNKIIAPESESHAPTAFTLVIYFFSFSSSECYELLYLHVNDFLCALDLGPEW